MTYELVLAMHSTYDSYERIRAIRARILLRAYTMCPRFELFIVRSRILCVYMKATIRTYYYDYSSTSIS